MLQVALRMDKIKPSTVEAADKHNRRLVAVPNANSDAPAYRIYGDKDKTILELLEGLVESLGADMKKMRIMKGETPNKQTTIVNEWVLSASPEYFRPGREYKAGVYDQDRVDAFVEAATKWAQKKFGKNLLAIDVHLDETTPHLHISTAPLVSKEKHLRRTKDEIAAGITKTATHWSFNSTDIYTPEVLREFQTDIGNSMAHLGLQRGIPSKAKNIEVEEFYGLMHRLSRPEQTVKKSVAPEGAKFKEAFDIEPPEKPSPFNFKTTGNWVRRAFKIIKGLRSVINREIGISNQLRTQSHEYRVAAEWHKFQYERLRQAQLDIYVQYGNDPEKMIAELKRLTDLAKDEFQRGSTVGAENANKLNERNADADLETIRRLNNQLDRVTGERNQYKESHDKLEQLKYLKREKIKGLDR